MNSKKIFPVLFYLITIIIPSVKATKSDSVSPILIKYKFLKHYPITFKIGKSGNIYIGDDQSIYKFNANGDFKKITLISSIVGTDTGFLDFCVDDNDENIYYVSISKHLIGINSTSNKKIFDANFPGSHIQSLDGKFYTLYQSYNEKKNVVINKLWILDKTGKGYSYATDIDFSADNFQIINSFIYLNNAENKLYKISTTTNSVNQAAKLNLPEETPIFFLGCLDNKFLFKVHDYKKRVDSIYMFRQNFEFYKKEAISLSFNEISNGFKKEDSGNWLEDFPSGNIYFYDGNNHISLLRNTVKGTYIYDIRNLINLK